MSLIRKLIKYWNKEHRADDGLHIMMRACYINLVYCVLLYLAAGLVLRVVLKYICIHA